MRESEDQSKESSREGNERKDNRGIGGINKEVSLAKTVITHNGAVHPTYSGGPPLGLVLWGMSANSTVPSPSAPATMRKVSLWSKAS